ncbi:MAG TPA: hypothetical protein VFE47_20685 [Tepidisphaeraceae bacterium]|jgi:hypothetical protein|nr:hypothetical protein [Tepidisphaeraceae bacterium]
MRKNTDRRPHASLGSTPSRVGSDLEAAKRTGGKLDFGIPASAAKVDPGGRAKGPEQGTGPMRGGTGGTRTTGVGAPGGTDGAGSGGDIDTDIIGLDGRGGLAGDPGEHRTQGADMSFARNQSAGEKSQSKRSHASVTRRSASDRRTLDTVDHSGGDVTTTGDESSPSTNPEIEEIGQESQLGIAGRSREIASDERRRSVK